MPIANPAPADHRRQQLADTAARIVQQDGIRDFEHAKRKAGKQLGVPERDWPSNADIAEALAARQALFDPIDANWLTTLRQTAVDAMQLLQPFKPKLVGDVLTGVVTAHSAVELFLSASTPEDVQLFLIDRKIPFEEGENRLRTVAGSGANKPRSVQKSKRQPGKSPAKPWQLFPCVRFLAGDVAVELTIFSHDKRATVYSAITQQPVERGSLATVQELLATTGNASR